MSTRTEKRGQYLDKLNYCPCCFNTIRMENLAYELGFAQGYTWDEIKKETVGGINNPYYVSEADDRRKDYFGAEAIKEGDKPIILLEGRNGRENGLKLFCESLRRPAAMHPVKREDRDARHSDWGEDIEAENLQMSNKDNENYSQTEMPDTFSYQEDEKKGIITFRNSYSRPVMYALACCPFCHMRLPVGWRQAESFGAVALMGPLGSGKTTILLSMMSRRWQAFQSLYTKEGKKIHITPAHHVETDQVYRSRVEDSDKMCIRDEKSNAELKCPDSTDRTWILPVFVRVDYDGHTIIIGIYDNAGENLENPDPQGRPYLEMLLSRTFADIYLFEPEDLNFDLPKKKKKTQSDALKFCELLDLHTQGNLQKKNHGLSVAAREVLSGNGKNWSHVLLMGEEEGSPTKGTEGLFGSSSAESFALENGWNVKYKKNALDVYNAMVGARIASGDLEHMKDMYFLGVIVKCDLLQEDDAIGGDPHYGCLFERNDEGLTDINQIEGRSETVKELLMEKGLLEENELLRIGKDYGKGQTWHCVSALGCDAEENGPLHGEYSPIRIAEPLVTCILRKLYDEGMMKQPM